MEKYCFSKEKTTKKQIKNILCFLMILVTFLPVEGQKYFSPNPSPSFSKAQSTTFLSSTPEIALKAGYYNISKAVLETVLILQSNAGKDQVDGAFNYGRVQSRPELTLYPAFSKSKNGYIICSTRSRGVEATAISLSLLRNKNKEKISTVEWLKLIFGANGDLHGLVNQGNEIYLSLTGKSFKDEGFIMQNEEIVHNQTQINNLNTLNQNISEINHIEIPEKENDITIKPSSETSINQKTDSLTTLPDTSIQTVELKIYDDRDINSIGEQSVKGTSNSEDTLSEIEKSSDLNNINTVDYTELSLNETQETETISIFKTESDVEHEYNDITIKENSEEEEYVSEKSVTKLSSNEIEYYPTDKGTWLYGGAISLVLSEGDLIFDVNPNYGYFLGNNFALGINLRHYQEIDFGSDDDFIHSLGFFLRGYAGKSKKVKVFGQIGGSVSLYNFDIEFPTFGYSSRVGWVSFLNHSIAMEYAFIGEIIGDNDPFLGFVIGFQVHFNKSSK